MIDDNPIDYESEYHKAINKLVKLRQKYDELEEDRNYVKSLLDVEFEKRIKLQKENEQLKTKISFIIDNRIRVYQKHIKKCESMLKLNDDAKQYSDLFNAKVEELEQLKKELLEVL